MTVNPSPPLLLPLLPSRAQGNERHLMCIEDPFELNHDLGRTIDKAAVQVRPVPYHAVGRPGRTLRLVQLAAAASPGWCVALRPSMQRRVQAQMQVEVQVEVEMQMRPPDMQLHAASSRQQLHLAGVTQSGADPCQLCTGN